MKLFTLNILILLSSICYSQSTENYTPDSLRKYSYFIFGIDGNLNVSSGTGYFVRQDKKIFFVTANHVLTGCHNTDTCSPPIKRVGYPSEMTIFLTSSNGVRGDKVININISSLQSTLKCADFSINPDVAAYQLTSIPIDTVYSIEKFLNKKIPKKRGAVSVFGYPGYANDKSWGYTIVSSTHLLINKYDFYEFYKYKACWGVMAVDSQDYLIKPVDSFQLNLFGYSGSPAFVFNKRKKKWHFMGTFVGSVELSKYLFIKPKYTSTVVESYH